MMVSTIMRFMSWTAIFSLMSCLLPWARAWPDRARNRARSKTVTRRMVVLLYSHRLFSRSQNVGSWGVGTGTGSATVTEGAGADAALATGTGSEAYSKRGTLRGANTSARGDARAWAG